MARRTAPEPVEEIEEEIEELEDEADDLEELSDDDEEEVAEDEADDDLEELDEEEEVEPEPVKPAKKAAAKKTTTAKAESKPKSSGNDSNWLASVVSKHTGKDVDARQIRVLLRKLAKSGDLAREVGTDRSRYEFPLGVKDPIVRQVVALVKSGALEKDTTDRLAAARQAKADKAAAAGTPAKKAPTKRAAAQADAQPVAPVRKRAAKTAAPAKAAPVKRTRRAPANA